MRRYFADETIFEYAQILLPPQIAHSILPLDTQMGPLNRDLDWIEKLEIAVEQTGSDRTVLHPLRPDFFLSFSEDTSGLVPERILIDCQDFVICE